MAEEVLLSGLTNMGYRAEEKPLAIDTYADSLNEYHLFDEFEPALAFAEWSRTRDPGHGPWFVTGLYRIDNVHVFLTNDGSSMLE